MFPAIITSLALLDVCQFLRIDKALVSGIPRSKCLQGRLVAQSDCRESRSVAVKILSPKLILVYDSQEAADYRTLSRFPIEKQTFSYFFRRTNQGIHT